MTSLQKIRQRFVVALIALAVLNVAFIAFLLWPGTSNRSARLAEKKELQQQLKLKTLRGLLANSESAVPAHMINDRRVNVPAHSEQPLAAKAPRFLVPPVIVACSFSPR